MTLTKIYNTGKTITSECLNLLLNHSKFPENDDERRRRMMRRQCPDTILEYLYKATYNMTHIKKTRRNGIFIVVTYITRLLYTDDKTMTRV